ARGFTDYYGFTSGHWGDYFSPPLEHNGQIVRGNGFIIDDLTDHAMAFMEQNAEKPFFCYVPFNTPHSPMQVPDRFYEKFRDADLKMRWDMNQGVESKQGKKGKGSKQTEDLEFTRAALAMCENIDWNVGRLLEKLDALKISDRTIVLYFCDNGPNGWRWNGGMRGRKGSTDEGGVRSPMLMRWPGHIPAGTKVTQIAGAIDLLPTLTEMCGVPVTSKKKLDGLSVAPLVLKTKTTDWPERTIFSHWGGKESARSQQYRLDAEGRLYDLTTDPGQHKDIAADKPEIASRMSRDLDAWRSDVLSELPAKDDRPFTVGYREFPLTHLPARDGVPHGNIKRSAGAPNCSFFTNWTNTDDHITWNVEVATPGRYEATLYYTLAEADVGPTIELGLHDSKIRAKLTEAHDPPLYGSEHDRADRGAESLVKDFKPLVLGQFDLNAGRGELTLRALEIPGKRVIDVRLVSLKLLN
ncbi:MAG TPA: sulfatase-like hydrolase/transferase, partial [Pirellulales bacterium]|nr:sulfatase-like hydrolase/transferase [Pirellulales bacterium]